MVGSIEGRVRAGVSPGDARCALRTDQPDMDGCMDGCRWMDGWMMVVVERMVDGGRWMVVVKGG